MGDSREDNLIVFFKMAQSEEEAKQEEQEQPKRKMSDCQILAMASCLLDEGYSTSFDRCLKVATITDGDIEASRDLLSKITITEN